ncbi:hypothetical protein B9G55_09095 [Saccharibacillus sp. O16]|nr:hypothetical protein B9G55_09095 [Saccharibacillus sp. O16]
MAFGPGSIAVVVGVALLVFGPKKLPELGRAAGETLKEFRSATRGISEESPAAGQKAEPASVPTAPSLVKVSAEGEEGKPDSP